MPSPGHGKCRHESPYPCGRFQYRRHGCSRCNGCTEVAEAPTQADGLHKHQPKQTVYTNQSKPKQNQSRRSTQSIQKLQSRRSPKQTVYTVLNDTKDRLAIGSAGARLTAVDQTQPRIIGQARLRVGGGPTRLVNQIPGRSRLCRGTDDAPLAGPPR